MGDPGRRDPRPRRGWTGAPRPRRARQTAGAIYPHIALERSAPRPPLERLEPPTEFRGLGLGHDTDREDASLLPILFDLGQRKTLRHRSSQ
jgi:hypothetical protein